MLEHSGRLRYFEGADRTHPLGELHVLHCALFVGGECTGWPADAPVGGSDAAGDARLEFVTREGSTIMAVAINTADAHAWRAAVQRVRIRLANLVDLHHMAGACARRGRVFCRAVSRNPAC